MRGYLQPSVQSPISDAQQAFAGLSRHRRTKLARTAQTTLLKADQWSRGGAADGAVAKSLESGLKALQSKKK